MVESYRGSFWTLGLERDQCYQRMGCSISRAALVTGISPQSSLLFAFLLSTFTKLEQLLKSLETLQTIFDYRFEHSCKEVDLLCLNAKLISSEWWFHMVKPIKSLVDFFHLLRVYGMSLMLPAAWLSLNTNSRGKKTTLNAIGSLVFHLDSYCTAKANIKQPLTIAAISQMPC